MSVLHKLSLHGTLGLFTHSWGLPESSWKNQAGVTLCSVTELEESYNPDQLQARKRETLPLNGRNERTPLWEKHMEWGRAVAIFENSICTVESSPNPTAAVLELFPQIFLWSLLVSVHLGHHLVYVFCIPGLVHSIYMYICMCIYIHTYTHIYTYIHTYIFNIFYIHKIIYNFIHCILRQVFIMYLSGWPRTSYIDQGGLQFTEISVPLLGLRVCTTTPAGIFLQEESVSIDLGWTWSSVRLVPFLLSCWLEATVLWSFNLQPWWSCQA